MEKKKVIQKRAETEEIIDKSLLSIISFSLETKIFSYLTKLCQKYISIFLS